MKITKFHIEISKKNVCMLIDADENSDIYEEVLDELEEMLPLAYEKIKPVALLEFGDFTEYSEMIEEKNVTEALYGINSIGEEMSAWATQLFQEGNYLGGMLADAIADDYLFQMDAAIQEAIINLCKERKRGIVRRLEAPQDVPMSIQKKAYDVTDAGNQIGLGIKESYMFDPVKSVCQVYALDQNDSRFCAEHDCTRCPNYSCKMRREVSVKIVVKTKKEEKVIYGKRNKTILEILRESGIFLTAVCAGKGTCGKCKVQVIEGEVPVSKQDLDIFTAKEIGEGYRLACRAYLISDCVIKIENTEEESFFVLADQKEAEDSADIKDPAYGIAADIGTTTVAMQLVELETGKIIDVFTSINKQRAYGADVISRIEASNNGKKEELKEAVCEIIREGILKLSQEGKIKVSRMVIGANTTMVHLLMGYSCETLGVYPFTPVHTDTIHTNAGELLGLENQSWDIIIYPGISTYVGGDITAGLFELDFLQKDKVSVFIDLGTNGEMAIGNKEKILVTSTAAGPAFEGGNIVCGTGSIPGAISKVEFQDGKFISETIGRETPKGICGTGVIDTIYELVKEKIVDETGLMDEDYFEDGIVLSEENNIRFYQKDVRELQLAKSAVRAGLETLILRFGVTYEDIDFIYVAGGFGCKMDIRKAIGIGLLPEECGKKIVAVGNTCLKGSVKYLLKKEAENDTERIKDIAEEINLSTDKAFQDLYMEHMYFGM